MDERKSRGNRGEALVAVYLRKKKYTILEQQFRTRRGEIDLIARSPEGVLCFVEVKTREDDSFASAREFVTAAKQKRLRAAAGMYLMLRGDSESLCRFDVAEVYLKTGILKKPEINYIEQAF